MFFAKEWKQPLLSCSNIFIICSKSYISSFGAHLGDDHPPGGGLWLPRSPERRAEHRAEHRAAASAARRGGADPAASGDRAGGPEI